MVSIEYVTDGDARPIPKLTALTSKKNVDDVPDIRSPLNVPVVKLPAAAVVPPMTVPSMVPALMSIVEGAVPNSTIAPAAFSVNRRLSVTFTANSPCTKSPAVGIAVVVELFFVIILVAINITRR